MIGTVLRIPVTVGTMVAAGDEMVVIESMKMEIPITAPVAGRVTTIAVAAGDSIQEGDPLLTIVS